MGKLAEDQAAQFEEHYFHCQQCQEALQLGQRMQRGFKTAATQQVIAAQAAQKAAVFAWLWRRRGAWGAVLMLALMALPTAWMWRHSSNLERQLQTTRASLDAERSQALVATETPRPAPVDTDTETAAAAQLAEQQATFDRRLADQQLQTERLRADLAAARQPSGNTQVVYLGAERSAAAEAPSHRLRRPDEATWIVLALEIEPDGHASYEAELFDASGTSVWRGDSLRLDAQDTVNVSVHSSFLEPGDYRLELHGMGPSEGSGATPSEAVGTFSLRVE